MMSRTKELEVTCPLCHTNDQYEIDIDIDSVREFLNDLAKIVDRPDTFDIRLESD